MCKSLCKSKAFSRNNHTLTTSTVEHTHLLPLLPPQPPPSLPLSPTISSCSTFALVWFGLVWYGFRDVLAKGVVGGSQSGSLVDFSRKTGADLALLEAKAGKSKRRPGSSKTNGKKRQQRNGVGSSRKRGKTDSRDSDTDDQAENDDDDYDDGTSAEITITDEFGRDRAVSRGGLEHRAYLEAKKAAAESRAEEKAQIESFDERYSYRGNGGSTAPHNATSSSSFASFSSGGGTSSLSGGRPGAGATAAAAATSTAATTNAGGGWAWSSGVGRGADAGDFETREGQERRAKDGLAELLQREGGGAGAGGSEVGKDGGGAKVRVWSVVLL